LPSTLLSVWRCPATSLNPGDHVNPAGGLVFLTDGVVERRGADIADGLEELRTFVAENGAADVHSLAGSIAHEFCATPHDDCCIVVIRRQSVRRQSVRSTGPG
jgi:Stage II sporulation protein E (SpoIIE)